MPATPPNEAKAKLARIHGGLPHFAEVTLTLERSTGAPSIGFACSGRGFLGQGQLEEVPEVGYDAWKAGGRAGVELALSVAGLPSARVTITRIAGLSTDTNPTVVGAAAAHALWSAAGYSPSADVVGRLEAAVLASWRRPVHEVPRFT